MRLLHEAFDSAAAARSAKTAVVCGGQRISYGELRRRVEALSRRLRAAGVQRGDRVVLWLEGDADYAVALHAVLHIGAVIVPLSASTKPDKLAFVLQDTAASTLLAAARSAAAADELRARCPALRTVLTPLDFDAPPGPDADSGLIDQDLAALIYTSGSTGRPKGVMLSHHNMASAWASVQAYLELNEDDVIALALPPTFSYGLYNLLMGLGLGATVVLERQAAFPMQVAKTLAQERATVLPAVPMLLAGLLQLPPQTIQEHAALRIVTNAAAALPLAHVPRVLSAWPRARLYSMYGMTECKRISYLPPEQLATRPGSVGRGMPNQEHWLVDEHGRRLPPGSRGELVVRGSHVMRGYWKRPEETAERLRPDPLTGERVLHTGDLFDSDEEGYLYFRSRLDDIIKTRGEKVAPREVEDVLHALPGVSGCAVVGIPHESLGEAVKAYVTLTEGSVLTAKDVVRHCQARLESHMVPAQVEFVSELPRTESGKVRHAALRER